MTAVSSKALAAARRAMELGIEPHDPCALSRSESVCAALIEKTLPNAPVGTRVKITVFTPSQGSLTLHTVLNTDTILFDNAGNALHVETGTSRDAVFLLHVPDPANNAETIVSGAVKEGTYITGMSALTAAMTLQTDRRTGELHPPEKGTRYVDIGDVRMSARRDLSSLTPGN